MLRIDIAEESAGVVRIRLSGNLTGPWVKELGVACANVRTAPRPIALDLTELHFADVDGQRLLRSLRGEGYRLDGISPFLAAQLADGKNAPTDHR